MLRMALLYSTLSLLTLTSVATASESMAPLQKAEINLHDKDSLQRGAKIYMNYCSGCHSLQYMRFNRLAKDIGITNNKEEVVTEMLVKNLMFTDAKIGDTLRVALPKEDAKQWFGVLPPDLTLVARSRGTNWLYTYLLSFYQDKSKPWGTNNRLFPDVAMPNILAGLQGDQLPLYKTVKQHIDGDTFEVEQLYKLQLLENGAMTQHEFKSVVNDLVTFLAYVAEPIKLTRMHIGIRVLLFLLMFAMLTYFLKKEYWKDIK